jgi:hypothetical protein
MEILEKLRVFEEFQYGKSLTYIGPMDAKELGRAQLPCARSRKYFLLDW